MKKFSFKSGLAFMCKEVAFNPPVIFSALMVCCFLMSVELFGKEQPFNEVFSQYPARALLQMLYVLFSLYFISLLYLVVGLVVIGEKIPAHWQKGEIRKISLCILDCLKLCFVFFIPLFLMKTIYLVDDSFYKLFYLTVCLYAMKTCFDSVNQACQGEGRV